jgi:hypothetical protein
MEPTHELCFEHSIYWTSELAEAGAISMCVVPSTATPVVINLPEDGWP